MTTVVDGVTKHGPWIDRWIDRGCVVTYRVGDAYGEQTYSSCFGHQAGSARLRPLPPSLMPDARSARSDGTTDTARKAVYDHAHKFCATSPHQRDVMTRRVGPFVIESRPGLILSDVQEAMFAEFAKENPAVKLKESKWKVSAAERGPLYVILPYLA